MIGILLAAGFSLRFGEANKLLELLPNGSSIALTAARNLIAILPVSIAVVRPDNQKLAEQFGLAGLKVLVCMEHQKQMADSLAAAVKFSAKFSESGSGFVIALADMPFIRPITIETVVSKLCRETPIVLPTYHGSWGHPVGLEEKFRGELEKLEGDEGARSILKRHKDEVYTFECEDPGILFDIDTPADFAKI